MFELRDYQEKAHNSTISHMRETYRDNKFDPAFVSCSVGGGKTVLIAAAIQQVMANPSNSVLVLARQGELIAQGSETARAFGIKLSIFSASLSQKSTYYPVIFGTEGSVGRGIDREFKDRAFTAILIDECHHVNWQSCLDESNEDTQYGKLIKHFIANAKRLSVKPPLIIGYTGSPYRGSESIYGPFWRKQLTDITTYELINKGFLVPPVFGFADDENKYESMNRFEIKGGEGAEDFSAKELAAMGRAVCKEETKTQQIMQEVIHRTKDKLGVLITCASKKHCEQVAECLPDGTWGIVTDSTSAKNRMDILSDAKAGKIKYVIQIGCLTTGVDISQWQVCVILRKIGSLTLLIQLIGRVLRTLKPFEIEQGIKKDEALILDFTDTLDSMGDIYDDPIVQQAMEQKGTKGEGTPQECPLCATMNSEYAVRCIGQAQSSEDGRCEHYFMFNECGNCGAHNAPSAKTCRTCDAVMIDPNANLKNKAYTDADYKKVLNMSLTQTQTEGIWICYELDSTYMHNGIEYPEIAKEYFNPFSSKQWERATWRKFVSEHVESDSWQRGMMAAKNFTQLKQNEMALKAPTYITHRKNDKGFSIINRKKFD